MEIGRIYISIYRKDLHQARMCVASIRYWYPNIPIFLIKDNVSAGDFDTNVLERAFNVRIMESDSRAFGWGYGKFKPLTKPSKDAFLFLDADTIMSGPILDRLSRIEADIIVDEEVQPLVKLLDLYYDPALLKELDPGFTYPGFSFNAGQFATVSGLLTEEDLKPFLDWGPPPRTLHPHIFKNGDQGLLNYLVQRKQSEGAIRVARLPLMIWPQAGAADHIDLEAILRRQVEEDRIVHWAGMKGTPRRKMPRNDLLDFFQREYTNKIGRHRMLYEQAMDAFYNLKNLYERLMNRLTARR